MNARDHMLILYKPGRDFPLQCVPGPCIFSFSSTVTTFFRLTILVLQFFSDNQFIVKGIVKKIQRGIDVIILFKDNHSILCFLFLVLRHTFLLNLSSTAPKIYIYIYKQYTINTRFLRLKFFWHWDFKSSLAYSNVKTLVSMYRTLCVCTQIYNFLERASEFYPISNYVNH